MLSLLRQARLLRKRYYFATAFHAPLPPTSPTNVNVYIDGRSVLVPSTATILQACAVAGVDIPRFCYHERLAIAGNCRMCLVQVNKGAKLVASCSQPVMKEMKVETNSEAVRKGREGVMEFLLANHPLDCPICDQGGECDLQDQATAFGSDRSRFQLQTHDKRAVEDKDFGPLVKTSMNRCIHCTRCVRFATNVAGFEDLGTTGRGHDMQIGMYVEKMMDSELSGNIIDLCPVGALTSKPYAFAARPWELRKTESIDVMDAVGSNIRIDSRGEEVMRILPRLNEDVNEEWLADKSRFACDGLRRQRLVEPLVKSRNRDGSGTFAAVTWEEALSRVSERLLHTQPGQVEVIAGAFTDVETLLATKDLMTRLGCTAFRFDGPSLLAKAPPTLDFASNYRFNATLKGIEEADAILLIGTNPRHEAPLLNARIRKNYLCNDVALGVVGEPVSLTFDYQHLGSDGKALEEILNGKGVFAEKWKSAKRPMIIVGYSALFDHPNASETKRLVACLAMDSHDKMFQDKWNGLNVLPTTASRIGALDIGWRSLHPRSGQSPPRFIYLLNADELSRGAIPDDAFVVYQGHHGDVGAQLADVILPGAAYTEKDVTFVNMEGRPQRTRAAVPPPKLAKNDWRIVRALSEFAGVTLPFDTEEQLRKRMEEVAPHLLEVNSVNRPSSPLIGLAEFLPPSASKESAKEVVVPFGLAISDYYLTDCISRNSPTMAQCSLAYTHRLVRKTKELDAMRMISHRTVSNVNGRQRPETSQV